LAPVVGHLGIARAAGLAPGPSPDTLAPAVRDFARATRFRASAVVATASELRHSATSTEQVTRSRRRLSVPLVVVSAGQRRSTPVADVLDALQRDQLDVSSPSCQLVAESSGHAVALGQPEIVVAAILAVVKASRMRSAPDCLSVRSVSVQRGTAMAVAPESAKRDARER
jgi:pimeloyl-ACP methyl ester carboxylesterase